MLKCKKKDKKMWSKSSFTVKDGRKLDICQSESQSKSNYKI